MMYLETVPAEPLPAQLRALVAPDAWRDHGTAAAADAWYSARADWHETRGRRMTAAVLDRAAAAELDDPAPVVGIALALGEDWSR